MSTPALRATDIAIIGLAFRVPGAADEESFWDNLLEGRVAATELDEETLIAAGVGPELRRDPRYVRTTFLLDGVEQFDAGFFGYRPDEAASLDPQQRLLLECAWEALESAGHDPASHPGLIGVYASTGFNTYFIHNLKGHERILELGDHGLLFANDKDFAATRISYKLDLRGPSLTVQTACSSSLVAVHLACQSLLGGECDMALAGGATLRCPQAAGYLFREGLPLAPDGVCRPFDAEAKGTVFGSGAGLVLLKRLSDALADGDVIRAVIRGSAINNDGANKVGYTAPSIEGQAAVVTEALAMADVPAETITLLEAHGTGTVTGDPMEVASLGEAFRQSTDRKQFCALGSVKANIGHLDTAAGVAGLIKLVLALERGQIPPAASFVSPNPRLGLAQSCFYVPREPRQWLSDGLPRRAAINSFGIGGTNAHAILEQAPDPEPTGSSRTWMPLLLSARSPEALAALAGTLGRFLERLPEGLALPDALFTMNVGRKAFEHRRPLVLRDRADAVAALHAASETASSTSIRVVRGPRPVAFLFPGYHALRPGLCRELYAEERGFAAALDRCLEQLRAALGLDLRELLCTTAAPTDEARQLLARTSHALPAVFSIEYALAQQWIAWGLRPAAMIGHSLGEYAAACLAGVFSLEEALAAVVTRSRLIETIEPGASLIVHLPEEETLRIIDGRAGLSLGVVNAPMSCIVSGGRTAVAGLVTRLQAEGIGHRAMAVPTAVHSALMDPIVAPFVRHVAGLTLHPPELPYISCTTGDWIGPDAATDPGYYGEHLRRTVRFADGLARIAEDPDMLLLEVGPGQTLTQLARLQPIEDARLFSSMCHGKEEGSEAAHLMTTCGELWAAGATIDRKALYSAETRRRVRLPTYPFQRQRHWAEPSPTRSGPRSDATDATRRDDVADWFYLPSWKQLPARPTATGWPEEGDWLLFADAAGLADDLAHRLRQAGQRVVRVLPGPTRSWPDAETAQLPPTDPEGYVSLLQELARRDRTPTRIVHLWTVEQSAGASATWRASRARELGPCSILLLVQALSRLHYGRATRLTVVGQGIHDVLGEEPLLPEQALTLGALRVLVCELPALAIRHVELAGPAVGEEFTKSARDALWRELRLETGGDETVVALRGSRRFVPIHEPLRLEPPATPAGSLPRGSVCLITGGFGGIGHALARHLAATRDARLVLVGRTPLPHPDRWDELLASAALPASVTERIAQVRTLEALGAEVLAGSADVADRVGMAEVINAARDRFGRIDVVIHAAGEVRGALHATLDPHQVELDLAAKVTGTLVLDELLDDGLPRTWCLCSSISTVLAPPGQLTYCAANQFLHAFARAKTRQGRDRALALAWDVWREVGGAAAAARATRTAIAPLPVERTGGHPLLDRRIDGPDGLPRWVTNFSPRRHWVLAEHRILGRALLPGTAMLEMVRAAGAVLLSTESIEIQDLVFLSPLFLDDDEQCEVTTSAERRADGFFVSLRSATGPGGEQLHAQALVHALPTMTQRQHELAALSSGTARSLAGEEVVRRAEQGRDGQPTIRDFGPRWRSTVRRVLLDESSTLTYLELAEPYAAEATDYGIHPALLDVANPLMVLGEGRLDRDLLPFGYQQVIVLGALPARAVSHARVATSHAAAGEGVCFDLELLDEAGHERLIIRGYQLRPLPAGQEVRAPRPASHRQGLLDRLTTFLEENLRDGLSVAEGIDVFEHALGSPDDQLLVSTRSLPALLRRIQALVTAGEPPDEPEHSAPAPQDSPPVHLEPAARGLSLAEIEQLVAAIWRRVLKVPAVGVDDNFFASGGTSVLLMDALGQLKQVFGERVAVVDLFRLPTIRALSAFLAEQEPVDEAAPAVEEDSRRARRAATLARTKKRRG